MLKEYINYRKIRDAINQIEDPVVRQVNLDNLSYVITMHNDLDELYDQLLGDKHPSERTTQILKA